MFILSYSFVCKALNCFDVIRAITIFNFVLDLKSSGAGLLREL